MNYYLIAGEASGDLHGSNLIKELLKIDKEAKCFAWGGELMESAGAVLRKHYRDLAFMGFVEVVKNIRAIFRNIDFCKSDILAFKPDVIILIDYPGFNLRIANWAKSQNIKVFYYISPQIWAWHSSRIHQIKRNVEKMFVILPFEKDFYKKEQFEVDFVGHPLLDAIADFKPDINFSSANCLGSKPIIAILPGSRKQEVSTILPIVLDIQSSFPSFEFVIAAAPSLELAYYKQIIGSHTIKIVCNQTYQLLFHSKAAIVASGTATLETALFNVPEVVVYKGNWLSYYIAKKLIDLKYISLVNLIADREIVKELIQGDFNKTNLVNELKKITDSQKQQSIKSAYSELRQQLGDVGASSRCADLIVRALH
ncbi:MAG: lipid-A-disaccharide synthase [Saprospiraceae bacterium]|jgi:lipid-A-disaccharide synthase